MGRLVKDYLIPSLLLNRSTDSCSLEAYIYVHRLFNVDNLARKPSKATHRRNLCGVQWFLMFALPYLSMPLVQKDKRDDLLVPSAILLPEKLFSSNQSKCV